MDLGKLLTDLLELRPALPAAELLVDGPASAFGESANLGLTPNPPAEQAEKQTMNTGHNIPMRKSAKPGVCVGKQRYTKRYDMTLYLDS